MKVDKYFAGCIKQNWLIDVVKQVLVSQGSGNETEVSLVITGQKKIRELNKIYLKEDRPTDVLSFPMAEQLDGAGFINAPDSKKHLGEVIVSFPQAVSQAEKHAHTAEKELAILIVHGLLHLVGYDHAGREERLEMQAQEKKILVLLEKAVV